MDARILQVAEPRLLVNRIISGTRAYARTLLNGSLSMLPYSFTRTMVPMVYLCRATLDNWTVYCYDSIIHQHNSTDHNADLYLRYCAGKATPNYWEMIREEREIREGESKLWYERREKIKLRGKRIMARTVIGCRVCSCKLVKNRMTLHDPNSPLPTHRHCWCQPIAPFDPVLRILQYPFYQPAFRIYPMEDEYFMEKILLNVRLGNPILSDSWLETYTSDSSTHSQCMIELKYYEVEGLDDHIDIINP